MFQEMIGTSSLIMSILQALRVTDSGLWLGGGSLRNHIWDKLTNRSTPHDDFDIVYFDANNIQPCTDLSIEAALSLLLPSPLQISVKNQARMHLVTGEPATNSLHEAVARWPETATAVAVRMHDSDTLEVIAPYGLTDLFNMVVRPSPYHRHHPASFRRRVANKGWRRHWPEIELQLD